MTNLRLVIVAVVASGFALSGHAANLVLSLVAQPEQVSPGTSGHLQLIAVNPSPAELPFEAVQSLRGRLSTDRGRWNVELEMDHAGTVVVQPGAFATRGYRFTVPPGARGQAVLEVDFETGPVLAASLQIVEALQPGASVPRESATSLGGSAPAEETVINRLFAGRLIPNEPTYFVYGRGKNSAAKFQFSFNYRVGDFTWGNGISSRILMGYTQRSLWNIRASSRPFYDTSYMPELSIDAMSHLPRDSDQWFTWIGGATGIKHESNGKDGAESRSLDTVYIRGGFAVGHLDRWHLIVVPELFTYISDLGDNERIKDYRGFGRFRAIFGRTNGPSLLMTAWAGRDFDHFTYQLDFSYPLRTHLLKIESFLLLQYFDGYGESLRDYDKKSDALRFGIELIR